MFKNKFFFEGRYIMFGNVQEYSIFQHGIFKINQLSDRKMLKLPFY